MKILITGAAGFLGNRLIKQLCGKHELFCISRNSNSNTLDRNGVHWIDMDLSKGIDDTKLPKKLDAIVHLAQSNGYRDFPAKADDVFAINISLVQQLLDFGVKTGISRMILASTGSVYEPYKCTMVEDEALRPSGHYGASKLAAELISEAYSNYFSVSNLRVFFLYGPGQENMLIARMIDSVKSGKTVTLPKDGKGLLFVPTFVDDCAFAFSKAVEEGWKGAYNVASPHAIDMAGLVRAIGSACGRSPNIEVTEGSTPEPIVPNLDKIRKKIDIDSFCDIDMGLERTIKL